MKKRAYGRYVKVIDCKSFYGSTEREVYRKILEYTEKKESGSTFAEIADMWWSEVYDSFAAQTLRGYKPAYARAVQELGEYFVKDITPLDMSSIFKRMALQGFTRKTISNQRIIYNQIFDYAVVSGEIQYNPPLNCPQTPKKAPQ